MVLRSASAKTSASAGFHACCGDSPRPAPRPARRPACDFTNWRCGCPLQRQRLLVLGNRCRVLRSRGRTQSATSHLVALGRRTVLPVPARCAVSLMEARQTPRPACPIIASLCDQPDRWFLRTLYFAQLFRRDQHPNRNSFRIFLAIHPRLGICSRHPDRGVTRSPTSSGKATEGCHRCRPGSHHRSDVAASQLKSDPQHGRTFCSARHHARDLRRDLANPSPSGIRKGNRSAGACHLAWRPLL
ncbi:unannotated protein [freshwater metagenome]|uniref:Unannotated protein n=1 Tax=freshwater metagenome TaxID=449393 RepID=A0A6J6PSR2_9ZZZZ